MTSEGTSAGSVFQRLYDSEINFSVSCFWDGGFIVRLGDDMNGFTDEEHTGRDWAEVERWLDAAARRRIPDSVFASTARSV